MKVRLTESFFGPDLCLHMPGIRELPEGTPLPERAEVVSADTLVTDDDEFVPEEPVAASELQRLTVRESNALKDRIKKLEEKLKEMEASGD